MSMSEYSAIYPKSWSITLILHYHLRFIVIFIKYVIVIRLNVGMLEIFRLHFQAF